MVDKLIKAEELAGESNRDLAITLTNGSRIIGKSLGIEPEADGDAEEIEVLAFRCPDLNHIFWFTNDQIVEVEIA